MNSLHCSEEYSYSLKNRLWLKYLFLRIDIAFG